MSDADLATYANSRLIEAQRAYDKIALKDRPEHINEAALIAIAQYLKLLVDSEVIFDGSGNIRPRPHIRQTYPSR